MGPIRGRPARLALRDRPPSPAPPRRPTGAQQMNTGGVGALLAEAFELYRRNVRVVLGVTIPIVVIVTGVTALGLGELTARFNPAPPTRDVWIDVLASGQIGR